MKKRMVLLSFLITLISACITKAENIRIYYINDHGDKIFLEQESFYDIEEKPTTFYISNHDDRSIYIIDIYRIIDSKEHFYRSFSLSHLNVSKGFEINGIFTDITSPFVESSGFIIKICRTDKQLYLKLKKREQCDLSVEYNILKTE